MKKTMIECLKMKANEMGHELTFEDICTFERSAIEVVSIRAGGYNFMDEYFEEHNLKHAYDDFERDPDNGYYEEFIEMRMEAANYTNSIQADTDYHVMSDEDYIDRCEREYYEATHDEEEEAYSIACKIAGFQLSDDEYMDFCEAYELQMAYATDESDYI